MHSNSKILLITSLLYCSFVFIVPCVIVQLSSFMTKTLIKNVINLWPSFFIITKEKKR